MLSSDDPLSGRKGIKTCCNPNNGIKISAARTAFFSANGGGATDFGCNFVIRTLTIFTRKTIGKII